MVVYTPVPKKLDIYPTHKALPHPPPQKVTLKLVFSCWRNKNTRMLLELQVSAKNGDGYREKKNVGLREKFFVLHFCSFPAKKKC